MDLSYLILHDRFLEEVETIGVHVVGPHKYALLACGHGEGADAGHDIDNDFTGAEEGDQAGVLALEPAVPVDLGVIEGEDATVLPDFDVEIGGSAEDLVPEGAKRRLGAYHVRFVDDCLDV